MIDRDAPLQLCGPPGPGAAPPLRLAGVVVLAVGGLQAVTGLAGPAGQAQAPRASRLVVTDATAASRGPQPDWAVEARGLTVRPVSTAVARAPLPPVAREQSFATVAVADGRTLVADGLRIRLTGLSLPDPAERCLRLDGRPEPCRDRQATQLALMVRWRSVTCQLIQAAPDLAEGSCRIGTSDLVARLTGPAHGLDRVAGPPVRLAAATELP
ncbi:MAG: hypothetical protein ACOYOJ_12770 [Alsobacter sp.]